MTLPHVLIEESVEEKFLSHSNIVEIERLDFNTTLENGVCL